MTEITVHYEGPIVTRKEALERGEKRFFTGKPCKQGHIEQRYTSSGLCRVCARRICKKCYYNNIEENREKSRSEENKKYQREWRKNNRDLCAEYSSEWRKRNPERGKEITRQYRINNPEYQSTYEKKRWAENKDELSLKRQKHQKENPEMWATYSRNRRAKKLANGGEHTAEEIIFLGEKQKWKCGYCPKKIKRNYHVDHIIAIKNGGSNDIKNLQLLCPDCNSKKRAKDPLDFAREIGKLL